MEDIDNLYLPPGYTYKFLRFDRKEESSFTCTVRIKEVRDEETASAWLSAYQKTSKVSWRVMRTHKSAGVVNLFHKDYRCQHNTDQRRKLPVQKKISKHTGCPATLKIRIKSYFEPGKRITDEDREFPCICEIYSWHNHSLDSAAVLKFRKMSSATKEKLLFFFQQGHTAASARHALQTELILENSDDYETLVADSSYLPSLSVIQHLFNNSFSRLCETRQVPLDLDEVVKTYCENSCGKAALLQIDSNVAVAICTPIMQRTIKYLPQVNDLIYVDAFGRMDQLNYKVYFFISAGIASGAPVGCILTDIEDEDIFRESLCLLKACFPEDSDLAEKSPKIFVTGDDEKDRQALSSVWPESTFLLCQFCVLKATWKWLCHAKNGIAREKRQELYFSFKDLVYAQTEEELFAKYEILQDMEVVQDNENILEYLSILWSHSSLWADCYRTSMPAREKHYTKSIFRVLKDIILDCVKTYSFVQLFDFIVTKFEAYLQQRYLDISVGRFNKSLLRNFLLKENKIDMENISYDCNTECYLVSGTNNNHFVDLKTCFCSCHKGSTGHICKHISSVAQLTDCEIGAYCNYPQEVKVIMRKIASDNASENGVLCPLSHDPSSITDRKILKLWNESDGTISVYENGSVSEHSPAAPDVESEDLNSESRAHVQVQHGECEDLNEELEKLFDRIRDGLQNNAADFHPAVKKFLQNAKNFASTETGLISALNNFAQSSVPSTFYLIQTTPVPVNPIIISGAVPVMNERNHSEGSPEIQSNSFEHQHNGRSSSSAKRIRTNI